MSCETLGDALPVQVLLPQYPIHPNLLSLDHTQPAKLQDPEAEDLKPQILQMRVK